MSEGEGRQGVKDGAHITTSLNRAIHDKNLVINRMSTIAMAPTLGYETQTDVYREFSA